MNQIGEVATFREKFLMEKYIDTTTYYHKMSYRLFFVGPIVTLPPTDCHR